MRSKPPSSLRRLIIPLAAGVLLAACGGDDGSTTTTVAPTTTVDTAVDTTVAETTLAPETTATPTVAPDTTIPEQTMDPAEAAMAYTELGPFPVGITTLELDKGNQVEVWYPAVEGTTGEDTYDMRDFVGEAISDLLVGDVDTTFTIAAGRDAAVADGSFPVILFSHGFTGMRLQSSALTSHLASWGFIVASPDHPSRDLINVLSGTASGDRADSVDDLLATLDLLIAADTEAGNLFEGKVDAELVAAVGHSAGGGTVLGAAEDERVDGYVSLASGAFAVGSAEAPTLPDVPSFFMAGTEDNVVSAEERTRPAFEAAPIPSLLWIIEGAGHNAFDDFCTFGGGTGIIGIAEAAGLGALLDAQPQLRSLGEDGCVPPSAPVTDTFPIIHHGVTAWVRALFGIDEEPVGLGPEVADEYAVPVEIQVRN